MFTSGTTGEPKGVMLTHGQSLRGFEMLNHVSLGLHVGDRHLVVPPFFHCFGYKAGWMVSLMFGATVLPVSVFDAPSALELIENERVTVVQGPPTMFHSLLSAPNLPAPQHSALRVAFVGASSVPGELIHRLHRELGFSSVMTGYGLTEASALVALTRKTDSAHMVANWAGRPIPDIEVRIVDDTGQSVSCGTAGEVLVRGYNLMKGYYEDSAATADVIDLEGWLHTGDIGVMNEAGYLKITDRKKDIVLVGGFNVSPTEVESILLGCDAIDQVALIGAPDDRLGEVGAAYVVLRPGATVTADEIKLWASAHMANFKVPRYVAIVESLPRNASGKVLKHELRTSSDIRIDMEGT
jgi:acyl-CoA synthetase (AMP-forming)/AMP-acid ligase II